MIMATVEDGLCWYLSFSVWDFTLGRILNNAKAHYTLARLRGFHFLPQFHVSGVWSYIITQFRTYRERNHLLFGKYQKLLPVWEPVVESGPNNLHLFITSLSMKNMDGSVSKVSLPLNQHSGSSDPVDLETHLKAFSLFRVSIEWL